MSLKVVVFLSPPAALVRICGVKPVELLLCVGAAPGAPSQVTLCRGLSGMVQ